MQHHISRQHVRLQMLITLVCILVFFLPLIGISVYYYESLKDTMYGTMHQDLNHLTAKSVESLQNNIESVISTYYNIISDPVLNPELYGSISDTTSYTPYNVSENMIADRLSRMMIYNVSWTNSLIQSITYYSDASHFYLSNGSSYAFLTDDLKQELQDIYTAYQDRSALAVRTNYYVSSKYDASLIYYVRDYHKSNAKPGGLVILQVDASRLSHTYQYFDKYEGALGILSAPDCTILASTDNSLCAREISSVTVDNIPLPDILADKRNYYTQEIYLERQGLYSTIIIPMQPIRQQLLGNMRSHSTILFLCVLLILTVCLTIPRYFSSYVRLLIEKMRNIRHGDYNIQLPESPITELNDLNQSFNYMSIEIKRLIHEVYESELLLKDAQIKSLQSQINPHFLFNILLCISWKARANHDSQVYDMVTALSSLMRANIFSDDNPKTTIEKEIETSRLYLSLQQYRFGEKLKYRITIDSSIYGLFIPKLMIQPIVENAVVHGLEKKMGPGLILISGKIIDSGIEITIYDDGIGCPCQNPEEVLQSTGDTHFQVGLKNCNKRLKQMYGEAFGLTLYSIMGEYTEVTIHIPFDKGD